MDDKEFCIYKIDTSELKKDDVLVLKINDFNTINKSLKIKIIDAVKRTFVNNRVIVLPDYCELSITHQDGEE